MILGVAIKFKGVMVCLPKPNRHHHCIHHAVNVLGLTPPIKGTFEDQGFYNVEGIYLNRYESYNYAISIGQEIKGHVRKHGVNNCNYLRSENLW